jgi:hypothetical protein
MTTTHPLHQVATRIQIVDFSEPERYPPVRLSLSTLTTPQAAALRIQALAGALGSTIALYLLASLYSVLRGALRAKQ